MPSTDRTNFLDTEIEVTLIDTSYTIQVYDTPLSRRWLSALNTNLATQKILEKNFCWLGWADDKRNLDFLVDELNKYIAQINSFSFDPPYGKIHPFTKDDFQYSDSLPIGRSPDGDWRKTPGLELKHEACNLLHRYFEDLQGTAWQLSSFYKQADNQTKYAIRQLNNLCHEIEGWVISYWKKVVEPEWMRPSQITTFLNAQRHDLHDEDFELFKENRYDRELGGVYLHWSQIGKTLYEVFRDEDAPVMDDALCSAINHQKFYSGEFDIEWGQDIIEEKHEFRKKEMQEYRDWLKRNNYDWNDPRLSLGYAKIGQVDLEKSFGVGCDFLKIYQKMIKNLNISSIEIKGPQYTKCHYPYTLESEDWRQIQMEGLRGGYESHNLR